MFLPRLNHHLTLFLNFYLILYWLLLLERLILWQWGLCPSVQSVKPWGVGSQLGKAFPLFLGLVLKSSPLHRTKCCPKTIGERAVASLSTGRCFRNLAGAPQAACVLSLSGSPCPTETLFVFLTLLIMWQWKGAAVCLCTRLHYTSRWLSCWRSAAWPRKYQGAVYRARGRGFCLWEPQPSFHFLSLLARPMSKPENCLRDDIICTFYFFLDYPLQ